MAETPTRFHVENMPLTNYILIPEVSSERRAYIPMGFLSPEYLSSNLVKIVPDASLFTFGVLTSRMHMSWVSHVCGRLESRYRLSVGIVYNNFPWPTTSEKQMAGIERAAQRVLDVRAAYPKASLADLYDPLSMPKDLVRAHSDLDAEIEKAYGKRFTSDLERVAFLFDLYGPCCKIQFDILPTSGN